MNDKSTMLVGTKQQDTYHPDIQLDANQKSHASEGAKAKPTDVPWSPEWRAGKMRWELAFCESTPAVTVHSLGQPRCSKRYGTEGAVTPPTALIHGRPPANAGGLSKGH